MAAGPGSRPFVLKLGWDALLSELACRPGDLLRMAALPEDLFRRPRPTVTCAEVTRLFDALAEVVGDDAPGLVLGHAAMDRPSSPRICAALCSENLAAAAGRLALFAPHYGPVLLGVHPLAGGLEVTLEADPGVDLPAEYVAAELVFLVSLARSATRRPVRPVAVEMVKPPRHKSYAEFLGHRLRAGPFNRVVFAPADAGLPFMSPPDAAFAAIGERRRLRPDTLSLDAPTSERVRAALVECLPAGQPDVATVSRRLGTTPRTLQRRLKAEGVSFQSVLQAFRQQLATDYLNGTHHTGTEIALLLGYDDPNSFSRAFRSWTGTTPEALRRVA